jgi:hypothetical protein
MSVGSWLRDYAPVVLGIALLGAAGLAVTVVGVALLAVGTGTDPLVVLGGTVAVLALLATIAAVTGLALVWTLVSRLASGLAGGVWTLRAGAAERVARVETRAPPLGRLGIADRIAPASYTPLVDPLKRQYVDGDISEGEFERRLEPLLATGRVDAESGQSVSTEREAAATDAPDSTDSTDSLEDEPSVKPKSATTVKSGVERARDADADLD